MLTVLQRENALLRSLLDCIDLELEALQGNDASGVEAAAEQKYKFTQGLSELGAERRVLLSQAGFTPDAAGIEDLGRQCEDVQGRSLRQAWEELLALGRRCYQGNARNGQLNAVAQRMLRQMLAHLRGDATNSDVYDREGRVAASDPKALGRV